MSANSTNATAELSAEDAFLKLVGEFESLTKVDTDGVDTLWILICASVVFLMQLGFSYLEVAGVRHSNVLSIAFKNLGDCTVGALCWWAFGYGLAFGDDGSKNPVIGTADWFLTSHRPVGTPALPAFFLSFVYGSTAATIVSGAVAERINFQGYYCMIIMIMTLVYPVGVHWFWTDAGWLSPRSDNRLGAAGCLDFAGGCVIHAVGGCMAFIAAWWLGPRAVQAGDVFSAEGILEVKGHDVFSQAVGTLLLWFAWVLFNSGGVTGFSGRGHVVAANSVIVTLLAGASATLTAMVHQWDTLGHLDLGGTCNCALAGLVAGTAPCAYVAPAYAPLIGVGGTIFYYLFHGFRKRQRVDDVLDASSVHFAGGVWGTIATGLFADAERVRAATGNMALRNSGLFIDGDIAQFGMQLVGILATLSWAGGLMSLLCWFLSKRGLLRVGPDEEEVGCDKVMCGGLAFEFNVKMEAEMDRLRAELDKVVGFPAVLTGLTFQRVEELEKEVTVYTKAVARRRKVVEKAVEKAKGRRGSAAKLLNAVAAARASITEEGQTRRCSTGETTGTAHTSGTPDDSRPAYDEHAMPGLVAPAPAADGRRGPRERSPGPRSAGHRWSSAQADESSAVRQASAALGVVERLREKRRKESVGSSATRGSVASMAGDAGIDHTAQAVQDAEVGTDVGDDWEPPPEEDENPLQQTPPPVAPTPPRSPTPSPPDWAGPLGEFSDAGQGIDFGDMGSRTALSHGYSAPQKGRIWQLIHSQRARMYLAIVVLLAGVTGAGAAKDRFFVLQEEAPEALPEPTNCSQWMSDAKGRIDALQSAREVFLADLDALWVLFCGTLVFLMQLGFAFLEAGGVRAMNVQNIVFKNLGDCCIGCICWWAFGYGVAFGNAGGTSAFIGTSDFFLSSHGAIPASSLPGFFLSFTYATTACTILSGAVAERITLGGYYVAVVVIMAFSYPVVVHWIWSGDGWLSPWNADRWPSNANGVLDFAGSAVIHMYGGASAFVGAIIIGPRKLPGDVDVFTDEGEKLTAPHNKFQSAVGTLMLWFSWFGFNAGSVGGFSSGGHEVAANAAVTTLLAGCAATVTALLYFPTVVGHYDLGHTCNAALAGLVAITAPCAYVSPASAIPIGIVAALVYLQWSRFRKWCRVDDVLDASSVHFAGGLWGTISVGIFADSGRIRAATGDDTLGAAAGLFMGGGAAQLGTQLLGALVVTLWAVTITTVIFYALDWSFIGLRVPLVEEYEGIDKHLCGGLTYDYLAQLEEQMALAESAAESIANMRLDDLEYLFDNENPGRLDLAFRKIVENLREYRAYLPESILNPEEDSEEGERAGDERMNEDAFGDHVAPSVDSGGPSTTDDVSLMSIMTGQPGRRRQDKRGKQTVVGVGHHRNAIVLYAALARPRGAWSEAIKQEQATAAAAATEKGMGKGTGGAAEVCKLCWHPILTTEFCSATGKRHDPPLTSVSGVLSSWLECILKVQAECHATFEGMSGPDGILSFDAGKRQACAARNACMAAVALRDSVVDLQKRASDPRLMLCCGLAGGGACAGNVGSEKTRRRVLLGDALADARALATAAKEYGVSSLVDVRVAKEALAQGFSGLREIAYLQLPEHTSCKVVFHLDASAPEPLPPEVRSYAGTWESLMRGELDEALQRLAAYVLHHPTDRIAHSLQQRVSAFRSANWKSGRAKRPFSTMISSKEQPATGTEEPPAKAAAGSPGKVVSPNRAASRLPALAGMAGRQRESTDDRRESANSQISRMSAAQRSAVGKQRGQAHHVIKDRRGTARVVVLAAQLALDLGERNGWDKLHGTALQTFTTTVRAHGGSVLWGGDDRLLARWIADEDRILHNCVNCMCALLRSGVFSGSTAGCRAGLGLSVDKEAWVGKSGGETDVCLITLGDAAAKAELMACCALSEGMGGLAEGIIFLDAPAKDFCWEPVACPAEFRRPPGRVLRAAGWLQRLRPSAPTAKEIRRAMTYLEQSDWQHARELLQSALDQNEDDWIARLQVGVLEAEGTDAEELWVTVTPSGLTVESSARGRGKKGDDDEEESLMAEPSLFQSSALQGGPQQPGSGSPVKRGKWETAHLLVQLRNRHYVRDILFPGDQERIERILNNQEPARSPPTAAQMQIGVSQMFGGKGGKKDVPKVVADVWQKRPAKQERPSLRTWIRSLKAVKLSNISVRNLLTFPALLSVLWNCIMVPVYFAFSDDGSADSTLVASYVADAVWFGFTISRFGEEYHDQGFLVKDRKKTAMRYLKGQFIVDISSCFPWELFWVAAQGAEVWREHKWLRLNRLMVYARVGRLTETCINSVVKEADVKYPVQLRLVLFILDFCIVLLWLGCVWGFGIAQGDRGLDGYLAIPGFTENPVHHQALLGFFSAIRGCAIGLFHTYPRNDEETAALLVMSLIGLFLFGVFLGYVQSLLEAMRSSLNVRDAKFDDLIELRAETKSLDVEGSRRAMQHVFDYHRRMWDKLRQVNAGQFDFLLSELPFELAAEVLYFTNRKVMDKIASLRPMSEQTQLFTISIVSRLASSFQPPGEILLRRGHHDDGVWFIYSGQAEARVGRTVVEQLGEGSYWGEMTAIWGGVQKATVTLTEYSELFVIENFHFRKIGAQFPVCFAAFTKSAEERKQRIVAASSSADAGGAFESSEGSSSEDEPPNPVVTPAGRRTTLQGEHDDALASTPVGLAGAGRFSSMRRGSAVDVANQLGAGLRRQSRSGLPGRVSIGTRPNPLVTSPPEPGAEAHTSTSQTSPAPTILLSPTGDMRTQHLVAESGT
eukprot:TRINITY_DN5234_c0_g2_i2.p1 TRINITY_DN5234_c0_g2~~TRINITY_DN5234_c0_g2_i2.p1  ORF type:complete len:2768 (+),score=500.81 TRINITY_DN5234_c0_g2_i2:81-8384(+)